MTSIECEFMHDVVRAAKTSQWTDALRTHAASCSLCRETIAMTTMMNEIAPRDIPRSLPNYRTIWLKARYARKQERFTKFDVLALVGVSFSGFTGLVLLLMVIFPQVFRRFISIPAISVSQLTSMFASGTPLIIPAIVAVLVWIFTRDSIFAGH